MVADYVKTTAVTTAVKLAHGKPIVQHSHRRLISLLAVKVIMLTETPNFFIIIISELHCYSNHSNERRLTWYELETKVSAGRVGATRTFTATRQPEFKWRPVGRCVTVDCTDGDDSLSWRTVFKHNWSVISCKLRRIVIDIN